MLLQEAVEAAEAIMWELAEPVPVVVLKFARIRKPIAVCNAVRMAAATSSGGYIWQEAGYNPRNIELAEMKRYSASHAE